MCQFPSTGADWGRKASFLTSSFVFAYFVAISLSAIASFNIAHATYKPCSHFSHNIALITSHYIVQNSKELNASLVPRPSRICHRE